MTLLATVKLKGKLASGKSACETNELTLPHRRLHAAGLPVRRAPTAACDDGGPAASPARTAALSAAASQTGALTGRPSLPKRTAAMSFRTHLESVVNQVDGALACSVMGFDGISVETHQKDEAGELELNGAWVEYANLLDPAEERRRAC